MQSINKTYRLADRYQQYNGTISKYIFKLGRKVKSPIKAHFFHPKHPISVIEFLATFKLACATNNIYKGTAV